jgi:hypothetical protein
VLLLGSITQQQPALLSDYLPQLKECMASFAGVHNLQRYLTCMIDHLAWVLCRIQASVCADMLKLNCLCCVDVGW